MSSRRTKEVIISDGGRDQGKVFVIEEMNAEQGEAWAIRVMSAMARTDQELPEDWQSGGMGMLASIGLRALMKIKWEEAKPLLDEMFGCVKIMRDRSHPAMLFALIPDDIQEVKTRLKLRQEVLELHTGFSLSAAPLTQPTADPANVAQPSSAAQMSPRPLRPAFRRAKPQ